MALLAFVGSIWSPEVGFGITRPLTGSIACFAFGVFLAACAAPASYVARLYELRETTSSNEETNSTPSSYYSTWKKRYNDAVFYFIVSSYGLFLVGIIIACLWFSGAFPN